MKDKCKDCYFSDNGDCTCSGVKMCVSNRDERGQTMSDVRLIDANELKRDFAELCATECPICSFYIPNADVGDCHCGLIDRAPTITPEKALMNKLKGEEE